MKGSFVLKTADHLGSKTQATVEKVDTKCWENDRNCTDNVQNLLQNAVDFDQWEKEFSKYYYSDTQDNKFVGGFKHLNKYYKSTNTTNTTMHTSKSKHKHKPTKQRMPNEMEDSYYERNNDSKIKIKLYISLRTY